MTEFNIWLKSHKMLIFIVIVISIIVVIMVDYFGYESEIQAYANMLMVLGLIAAFMQIRQSKKQLRADHEWNRRHFAMQEVGRVRRESKIIRDRLTDLTRSTNKYIIRDIKEKTPECLENCKLLTDQKCIDTIKFSDRFLKAGTLTIDEVHKWVCKYKCENDDIVMVTRDKGENRGDCEMTKTGELIRSDLIELINLYEEFAVGIMTGTIDEDIAKYLYKAPIIKNYTFFKEYIDHLVKSHNATNFAVNFRWLYEKWSDKSEQEKLKNTDD